MDVDKGEWGWKLLRVSFTLDPSIDFMEAKSWIEDPVFREDGQARQKV